MTSTSTEISKEKPLEDILKDCFEGTSIDMLNDKTCEIYDTAKWKFTLKDGTTKKLTNYMEEKKIIDKFKGYYYYIDENYCNYGYVFLRFSPSIRLEDDLYVYYSYSSISSITTILGYIGNYTLYYKKIVNNKLDNDVDSFKKVYSDLKSGGKKLSYQGFLPSQPSKPEEETEIKLDEDYTKTILATTTTTINEKHHTESEPKLDTNNQGKHNSENKEEEEFEFIENDKISKILVYGKTISDALDEYATITAFVNGKDKHGRKFDHKLSIPYYNEIENEFKKIVPLVNNEFMINNEIYDKFLETYKSVIDKYANKSIDKYANKSGGGYYNDYLLNKHNYIILKLSN